MKTKSLYSLIEKKKNPDLEKLVKSNESISQNFLESLAQLLRYDIYFLNSMKLNNFNLFLISRVFWPEFLQVQTHYYYRKAMKAMKKTTSLPS